MPVRLRDFERIGIQGLAYYRFRWVGSTAEWQAALQALKAAVDPEWRSYDETTHLWTVEAAFHDPLCEIFPDLAGLVRGDEVRRTQGALFDDEPTPAPEPVGVSAAGDAGEAWDPWADQ